VAVLDATNSQWTRMVAAGMFGATHPATGCKCSP
jgi:hypothetical protein